MPAGADGTNGGGPAERLARIEGKIDAILDRMDKSDAYQADHEKRLSTIERVSAGRDHQIAALEKRDIVLAGDIDRLDKKSEGWSIINSVAVAIAALLAIFGVTK
jgi:ATP-dependent helicase/DNAse subunit B